MPALLNWTGFTGFSGFFLLVALRKRAPKHQSPPANKNRLYIMVIKEVSSSRDETITVKLNDLRNLLIPQKAD